MAEINFEVKLPVAWNIGPVKKPEPLLNRWSSAVARATLPGDLHVREETGRIEATMTIHKDGELVAILTPEQISAVFSFWRQHRIL